MGYQAAPPGIFYISGLCLPNHSSVVSATL
jgi:hypothetical protein